MLQEHIVELHGAFVQTLLTLTGRAFERQEGHQANGLLGRA